MAMGRQRMEPSKRRPFYVYADEFHNFICPSMAELLSGARKYGMGFVLAHQDFRQLERDKEVASAVLSNAFIRVFSKVSDSDARTLSEGFAHFSARQLQNLPTGHAICRIGQSDNDFNLAVPQPDDIDEGVAEECRMAVIESSRARVAIKRAEAEQSYTDVPLEQPKPLAEPQRSIPAVQQIQEAVPTPVVEEGEGIPILTPKKKAGANRGKPAEPSRPTSVEVLSGRGGPTDKAIQRQVIEKANAQGLKAFPEVDILDGQFRLDVSVAGSKRKIACEVIVTSTLTEEINTLRECQACGYESGLLVCIDADKLAVAQARFERELPDFPVHYILPTQLSSYLKMIGRQLDASDASEPNLKRVANHDLTRRSPKLSAKDRQRIEENALQAIAITIKAAQN